MKTTILDSESLKMILDRVIVSTTYIPYQNDMNYDFALLIKVVLKKRIKPYLVLIINKTKRA